MGSIRILGVLLFLHCFHQLAFGLCYFPPEFQGEYKMQSTNSGSEVQYGTLNITVFAIPIWGNCHLRIGNNFILVVNYGETTCIRCLYLKLRSKNILQVHAASQKTISKCYTNEKVAIANCPSEESVENRLSPELILFKTKDLEGGNVENQYCPFDGSFSVEYHSQDVHMNKACKSNESSLDFCPSGTSMNIHFRGCTFGSTDLQLDCVGHWATAHNETYLILYDRRSSQNLSPQYRCALFKRHHDGKIHLAIGNDSTCDTDLHNSTHGYETLVLTPKGMPSWPLEVVYSQCSFPEWMKGEWEHMRVQDDVIVYKNHAIMKTLTIKCVGILDTNDKYFILTRTQCLEEVYSCMRIKRRSTHIIEFQLGINSSSNNNVFDLCGDENFEKDVWITQGRLDREVEASCPISGEYTGFIPNTTEVCAKLWSDCRAPELMYYQVSYCGSNEIFEEREYRCLGHWREGELLYTYTQRRDVASEMFECFVGSIVAEKEQIYIKEAGEHCQRDVDPLRFGMRLVKQQQGLYSCIHGHIPSTNYNSSTKTLLPDSMPTKASTKSWDVGITYSSVPNHESNEIESGSNALHLYKFLLFDIMILCLLF